MDFDVNGNYGKFNIKIDKNKAYLRLFNYTDLDCVIKEAINISNSYKVSNIYLISRILLHYEIAFSVDLYELEYTRFKPNKEYKMKPLLIENRTEYTKMLNESMVNVSNYIDIDESDTLEYLRNELNVGFFDYKREFIGNYKYDQNEIVYFSIIPSKRGNDLGLECLKKIVNKLDNDVIIKVSSDNKIMLSLIDKLGFKLVTNFEKYYVIK